MENKFKALDAETEHKDAALSFPSSMFKLGKFMSAVREAFEFKGLDALGGKLSSRGRLPAFDKRYKWFDEGVDCEVLKLYSKGWQKGKIRIKVSLEFCPDEPEIQEVQGDKSVNGQLKSLLDDVRQIAKDT